MPKEAPGERGRAGPCWQNWPTEERPGSKIKPTVNRPSQEENSKDGSQQPEGPYGTPPRDPRPKTGQGRLSSRGHRRGPKGRDGGRPRLPAPLPHSRPEPLVVRRVGRDLPQLWRPPTKIPPENEKQSGAAAAVPRQNFIKTHPRPEGVNTPRWLVIHRGGATLPLMVN